MNGISVYYVILIVVALGGAGYLYIKHRKAASTSSSTSSSTSKPGAPAPSLATELKAHIDAAATKIDASAKEHANAMYRVLKAEIDKASKPLHIAGTASTLAPAAQPAASSPAAPAPSAAAEPPPPAAAASAAGDSGTTQEATDPAAHASDQFYAAALAARAAQQQNEAYNGPVPASSLQEPDWKFLWWATINPATPKMHNWEYVVLSGSRAEIQQGLAHIGNDVARMRGYDATKYTGVLRAPYDKAVAA